MKTILYFQTPTKTSAPEKLAGVREIMDKKGVSVQVMEDKPSKSLVARLAGFWHPLGAIFAAKPACPCPPGACKTETNIKTHRRSESPDQMPRKHSWRVR